MMWGLFPPPSTNLTWSKKLPVRKYFYLTVQRSDKNVARAFYFSAHINLCCAPPQSLLQSSGSQCSTFMQSSGRHCSRICGAARTRVVRDGNAQLRDLTQLLCCCFPPKVSVFWVSKWKEDVLWLIVTLRSYLYHYPNTRSHNNSTVCICEKMKSNKHKNNGWNIQGRSCILVIKKNTFYKPFSFSFWDKKTKRIYHIFLTCCGIFAVFLTCLQCNLLTSL